MVREVLTVSVGQAGIQLGAAVWDQYCAEHGVLPNGKNPDTSDDGSFRCFFEETNSGMFVPRNLSVDLEPNVIDDVRSGYVYALITMQTVMKTFNIFLLC